MTTREFSRGIRGEMLKQLAVFAARAGWSIRDDLVMVLMTQGSDVCAYVVMDPASLPIEQRYQQDDPAHPQAIVVIQGPAREPRELGTLDPTDDVPARIADILRPFLAVLND